MKIRKVDDKPMVLHTKEKPKLRIKKKADVHMKANGPKPIRGAKKKIKDSSASVKVRNKNLNQMARMTAKGAMNQVDGGEEIRESAELASITMTPVVVASKKGGELYRKKKKDEKAKKQAIRKKRRQEDYHSAELDRKYSRLKAKKSKTDKKNGKGNDKSDKSGKKGGSSFGAVRNQMIGAFMDKFSLEQEEGGAGQGIKAMLKAQALIIIQTIITAVLPVVLIIFLIVAVVATIVAAILAVIYNSPLAIFFPQPETGYDNPRTVLTEYYKEFNESIAVLDDKGYAITYQNTEDGAPVSNFNDTLMVYMVKYGNGQAGYVMDEDGKKNLKEVFDEMNYLDSKSDKVKLKAGESLGKVVATGYCPCKICCGQYANGITASGKKAKAKHTIAVDAYDPIVPMGTKVLIGDTTYTVEDTGDLNKYGTDFDIYYDTHEEAQKWGKKKVKAYLAEGEENEVEVTSKGTVVHNLTYEDYIAKGTLSEDEEKLLRDMMDTELWEKYYSDAVGQEVADMAITKVGCHYDQGRRMEEGYYDCSSLVYRLYKEVGIELPGTAAPQGRYCYENAMLVNKKDLKPGDLIFYSYEQNEEDFMYISHVAIYIGDGKMVHAANKNRGVVLDDLRTSNVVFYARPYN